MTEQKMYPTKESMKYFIFKLLKTRVGHVDPTPLAEV